MGASQFKYLKTPIYYWEVFKLLKIADLKKKYSIIKGN
jgi:hypothetical protein